MKQNYNSYSPLFAALDRLSPNSIKCLYIQTACEMHIHQIMQLFMWPKCNANQGTKHDFLVISIIFFFRFYPSFSQRHLSQILQHWYPKILFQPFTMVFPWFTDLGVIWPFQMQKRWHKFRKFWDPNSKHGRIMENPALPQSRCSTTLWSLLNSMFIRMLNTLP